MKTIKVKVRNNTEVEIYSCTLNEGDTDSIQEQIEEVRVIYINSPEQNLRNGMKNNYIKTTKYSAIDFLPKSIFIQFKRLANVYFLIIAVLQSIPQISPLNPFTAIAPLVFVIFISVIREGIEDFLRYKSDKECNGKPVSIWKNGNFQVCKSQNIVEGDLILVKEEETFPCDLVILDSNMEGNAYIETGALDGEKNLKPRESHMSTIGMISDYNGVVRYSGKIVAEYPNAKLYSFSGRFEMVNGESPLTVKNILLSGSVLRNTKWIIGVAVYIGEETKLMMNSEKGRFKQSKLEKQINKLTFIILIAQLLLCIAALIIAIYYHGKLEKAWYLPDLESVISYGIINFFSYFLLLNTMIPISLIVSLEIVKIIQAWFLMQDLDMYCSERDRPCKVWSMSLNEELGQIEYIFSDKTGTLTCNKMVFKYCTIGPNLYGDENNENPSQNTSSKNPNFQFKSCQMTKELQFNLSDRQSDKATNDYIINKTPRLSEFELLNNDEEQISKRQTLFVQLDLNTDKLKLSCQADLVTEFWRALALCHEVIPGEKNGKIIFKGPSPDEVTLVDASRNILFAYKGTVKQILTLENIGNKEILKYDLLNIIEFNSDRKRMSVIIGDQQRNIIILFCKGADNVILKRLCHKNNPYINYTNKQLSFFSSQGFRTLCIAFKIIPQQDYKSWSAKWKQAQLAIVNKDKLLDETAELIEKDLILLGTTAIEDRLQDGVPKAIDNFMKAGIKVWVLTGDKLETAENIAKSCKLITAEMNILKIRNYEEAQNFNEQSFTKGQEKSGIIVEGDALEYLLEKKKKLFIDIANQCEGVICCRVTPGQKRDIVKAVKQQLNPITLSIGDGANDVGMILEAHVGIGLYGEEGMRAVQSSDYALGQFRFLEKLLLYHGRWNYIRQSELILYFFYKNITFTFPQFFFGVMNSFSGQSIYDDWYITCYNMLFTALPVLIKGFFERDIDISKPNEYIKEIYPFLFEIGLQNQIFSKKAFLMFALKGFVHAIIIFFIGVATFYEIAINGEGQIGCIWAMSMMIYTSMLLTVSVEIAFFTRYWTYIHHLSLWIFSISLYFLFIFIYDTFTFVLVSQTAIILYTTSTVWLGIFLTVTVCVLIDITPRLWNRLYYPSKHEIASEIAKIPIQKLSKVQPFPRH